jgi:RsiW-degrading membrane proteinase PrsW (M82 family)
MELTMVIIAALAPAVMLLYYIYRKDSFRKEPVKEVLKAFFFGVLSIFVSLTISSPLGSMGLYVNDPQTFVGAVATSFFGAAIPEEIAKFIMFWLIVRSSRYFDEHMDGIVYASSVALGFAALENVMYLISNYESWVSVGITRALFSVPGHLFFGVLMGYYYSLVRFDPAASKNTRWLVILAPVLAHGAYNSVLFVLDVAPGLSLILMVVFLWLCNKLRKYASAKIREHLVRDGVIVNE